MNLEMSVDFSEGGARSQTAHDRDQILSVNLAFLLLIVQREALFEFCSEEKRKNRVEKRLKLFIVKAAANSYH